MVGGILGWFPRCPPPDVYVHTTPSPCMWVGSGHVMDMGLT